MYLNPLNTPYFWSLAISKKTSPSTRNVSQIRLFSPAYVSCPFIPSGLFMMRVRYSLVVLLSVSLVSVSMVKPQASAVFLYTSQHLRTWLLSYALYLSSFVVYSWVFVVLFLRYCWYCVFCVVLIVGMLSLIF